MIEEYTVHILSDRHNKTAVVPVGQRTINISDLVPTFSYSVSVVVTYKIDSFMSTPSVTNVTLPECQGKNCSYEGQGGRQEGLCTLIEYINMLEGYP